MDLLKQEKGSITLFVLISMLFFVMFLTGMYMLSATAESGVIEEQARIKEIYEQGVNDIDNVYATINNDLIPIFTKKANEPDIEGFDKESTYYVSWNLNENSYQINEETNLSGIAPNNWYDYTEKVNHWANIKTTGGENDCYWVWIPRYAYKVPTKGNTAETIEVKFLKGKTNTPIDGTSPITNTVPNPGTWVVHPAFWLDKNNNGIEDSGEQLTGIWVAKYEASSSVVSETNVATDLNTTGGGNVTNLQIRVKPNVTSWRGITLENIFIVCRNLTKIVDGKENSLVGSTNLDSHLMKNTEWGAIAYLSRSIYGKNDEIWNNPYYNNTSKYSPITGLCGKEKNDKDLSTTDLNDTCKYNEIGGGNASTTGNVYGVYDMSGGAWEYVAAILSDYKANGNNTEKNNYYNFIDSNIYPNRYFDLYNGNSENRNANYNDNDTKYGDAIYETSNSASSATGSWDASNSIFPISNSPVFVRGGRASNGSTASVFAFNDVTGESNTHFSFRPVIIKTNM